MTVEAPKITQQRTDDFSLPDGPSTQTKKPEIISTYAIQLLDEVQPPRIVLGENREPVEAQIYNLLGDVTLPRSFLPAIDAIAREQIEIDIKGHETKHRERPDKLERIQRLDMDWPGKSEEADQRLVEKKERKLLHALVGTEVMANFRRRASDLSRNYQNRMQLSGTAEAYFTRASLDLWEEMSTYAKDFLTYGDRYLTVDISDKDVQTVLAEAFAIANGISRVKSRGSINLEVDSEQDKSYSWNTIQFSFNGNRVIGLSLDEGTTTDQHSPLISFIESEHENESIVNNISDGTQIGPFNVVVIFHEYGVGEHNIIVDIDTSSWTDEMLHLFLSCYIKKLNAEPKSEGKIAKDQLIEAGVISAEMVR